MKSIRDTAEALAEALELPEDALLGASRVSVTAGKHVAVENHRGLLDYEESRIVIRLSRGKLTVGGTGLCLRAMTADRLLLSGRIQTLEWE